MRTEMKMIRQFMQHVGHGAHHKFSTEYIGLLGIEAESIRAASKYLEDTGLIAKDIRILRAHLVMEEVGELLYALSEGDEVLALDAVADILYVVLGMGINFDWPIKEAFDEVHRSNMTKRRKKDDVRCREKGDSYDPPNIRKILEDYRK